MEPPAKRNSHRCFSRSILLVEDSPEIQVILGRLLGGLGLTVEILDSGDKALAAVREQHYDLIIMDLHMPVMDGVTATRLLRQQGFIGPIWALTADRRSAIAEDCCRAGCADVLTKPFSRESIIEKLDALFPNSVQNEGGVAALIEAGNFQAASTEFVRGFSDRMAELESAFAAGNFAALQALSHQLAGASAFAYPAVYEALIKLTESAAELNSKKCCDAFEMLRRTQVESK